MPQFGRCHDHRRVQDYSAIIEFLDNELSVFDPKPGKGYSPTTVDVHHDAPQGASVRLAIPFTLADHMPPLSPTSPQLSNGAYTPTRHRVLAYREMADYDFKVTDEFVEVYESLHEDTASVVDHAVTRLLRDHATAWARQGRVAGEGGEAWITEIRTGDFDISLYWDYLEDAFILLLLLIVRPA